MHREYPPEHMHHHHDDPFAVVGARPRHDHRDTAALRCSRVAAGRRCSAATSCSTALGHRRPAPSHGSTLTWAAALLGAVYIVYGALEALVQPAGSGPTSRWPRRASRRLVLGQPFVAAEVVFIALVGEVLEAVTFEHGPGGRSAGCSTRRPGRPGSAATASRSRSRAATRRRRRPGDRPARRADPGRRAGRRRAARRSTSRRLTGESIPVDKGPGDPVFTGTLNQFGVIEVRAEKVGHETTFGQVAPAGRRGPAPQGAAASGRPTAWPGTSCRWSRSSPA